MYYEENEEKETETKNCPECKLQEINVDEATCKGCSKEATKEEVEEMLAANEEKKDYPSDEGDTPAA
jgi:hypothetical protein